MLEGKEPSLAGPTAAVPVGARVGVIVYVGVGDVAPALSIQSTRVEDRNGAPAALIDIRNSGTAHGRLDGFLTGVDAQGQLLDVTPASTPILPGETRTIALKLTKRGDPNTVVQAVFPITVKGKLEWARATAPNWTSASADDSRRVESAPALLSWRWPFRSPRSRTSTRSWTTDPSPPWCSPRSSPAAAAGLAAGASNTTSPLTAASSARRRRGSPFPVSSTHPTMARCRSAPPSTGASTGMNLRAWEAMPAGSGASTNACCRSTMAGWRTTAPAPSAACSAAGARIRAHRPAVLPHGRCHRRIPAPVGQLRSTHRSAAGTLFRPGVNGFDPARGACCSPVASRASQARPGVPHWRSSCSMPAASPTASTRQWTRTCAVCGPRGAGKGRPPGWQDRWRPLPLWQREGGMQVQVNAMTSRSTGELAGVGGARKAAPAHGSMRSGAASGCSKPRGSSISSRNCAGARTTPSRTCGRVLAGRRRDPPLAGQHLNRMDRQRQWRQRAEPFRQHFRPLPGRYAPHDIWSAGHPPARRNR